MTLVPVDTTNALAVSDYLDKARQWLATAVEMTGPAEIAAAKAEIATAAEATRQLGLSKDIQQDAQEMVRRAEYALGRAIRKGQAEGTIAERGQSRPFRGDVHPGGTEMKKIGDIVSYAEWQTGGANPGIAAVADLEPDVFEAAVESAKTEGNLSRANVVRKAGGERSPLINTREQRADLIAELAAKGLSSRQMPAKVGVTEETVRQIARDFDIQIPADLVVSRTRRLDHTHMVASTVTDLENTTEFIEAQIDLSEVDFAEADEWLSSLTTSIRVLNRFKQQIKEHSHV